MGILSCRLQSQSWGYGLQGEDQVTLQYKIRTDALYLDFNALREAAHLATPAPLPRRYALLGAGAYVTNIHIEPQSEHSRTNYVATVTGGKLPTGTTPDQGNVGSGQADDPRLRAVVFWYERISATVEVDKDRDGNPVVNSAGQPFDTPVPIERWLPVLVAQRNYGTLSEIDAINSEFGNAVNSTVFRGWPAGQVQFQGLETGPPSYENGIEYYQGQMRFIMDERGFGRSFLNKGWRYYKDATGDPHDRLLLNATDSAGQLVTEPILLAADGTRLPEGDPGTYTPEYFFDPSRDLNPLIADPE